MGWDGMGWVGEYRSAEFGPNPLEISGRDRRELEFEVLCIIWRYDVEAVKAARLPCDTYTLYIVWVKAGAGRQPVAGGTPL